MYVPKAGQVTEYNAGKNKADFETFLVLGFGGRGHDLAKSFDVKYDGMEQVQGINAAKLELKPKSQKVANMFQTITLWIDLARGVSVQQLFNEPSGDYRLAKYNNIKVNRQALERRLQAQDQRQSHLRQAQRSVGHCTRIRALPK